MWSTTNTSTGTGLRLQFESELRLQCAKRSGSGSSASGIFWGGGPGSRLWKARVKSYFAVSPVASVTIVFSWEPKLPASSCIGICWPRMRLRSPIVLITIIFPATGVYMLKPYWSLARIICMRAISASLWSADAFSFGPFLAITRA
jgi:hypothetical protein